MAKRPKRPKKTGHAEEKKQIARIDLMRQCKMDVSAWHKLVKKKEFTTDLKMQNRAALIVRGMALKLQSLKAIQSHRDALEDPFIELVDLIARAYGHVWDKQSINLVVTGEDGGPIEHDHKHSIAGEMNLTGLQAIIRKDQEER